MNGALIEQFDLLAGSVGGVAKLRELILALAVRGKLVPQDPNDEPASELLKNIRAEKDRLIAKGKMKREKPSVTISEKPYELPNGWKWSSLAQIGLVSPRNEAPDDLPTSFVQMSSIPTRFGEAHLVEERSWGDIKSGFTHFAENDVGVAKITPCFENGKSTVFRGLANGIGAGTTELHIVRPIGGVLPDYVLLFLKTPDFLVAGERVMTGSAGQKRLPRHYFESTPFPLPPLAEQSRIVAKVEELMGLCDRLEAEQAHAERVHGHWMEAALDQLAESADADNFRRNWQHLASHFDTLFITPESITALESTLLQLAVRGKLIPQDPNDEPASELLKQIRAEKDRLIAEGKIKRDKPLPPIAEGEEPYELPEGWEWATLNELALLITDGAHHTPTYVEKGVPFLSVKDMSSGKLDFSDTRFISQESHRELIKRCNPELNDLLLTKIGTTGIAIVVNDSRPFSIFVSVALIKLPKALIDRTYLVTVINSPFVRQQSKDGTEGVGNKNLVLRKIHAFKIPLPPPAEQSRIVAQVERFLALTADLKARLAAAQTKQTHLAEALIAEVC